MNTFWNAVSQYPLALLLFLYHYSLAFIFFLTALILILTILFLQGKGDLGMNNAWQGSQLVFGGSGGQDFVSKMVWFLGFVFMFLCLIIAKVDVKKRFNSIFNQYSISQKRNDPTIDMENKTMLPKQESQKKDESDNIENDSLEDESDESNEEDNK